MSEMDDALHLMRSGNREQGMNSLRELLVRTRGDTTWARHGLTSVMSILLADPNLQTESEEIFRDLVPQCIDRSEFMRCLERATDLLFDGHSPNVRFHHCNRELSVSELVDDLWLEDGYLRWVNLYRCGRSWVQVECGGVVDTFREVLHHEEGVAPFHLLVNFESLEELDCVRVGHESQLGTIVLVHSQPYEAYEVELAEDEGVTLKVRPWELRKAYFGPDRAGQS